jgi:hypothetical protein
MRITIAKLYESHAGRVLKQFSMCCCQKERTYLMLGSVERIKFQMQKCCMSFWKTVDIGLGRDDQAQTYSML